MTCPWPKAWIGVLLLAGVPAAAQMRVEVVSLQHRLAEDVIPVIRPLLVEGGSVTGMNNQLVLKTTTDNLEQIRMVLDSIDQRLRQLRISVRQDADLYGNLTRQSISGRAELGDVTLRQEGRPERSGVSVGVGDEDANVRYQRHDQDTNQADRGTYQVQTIEGQPAFIRTGQAVPIPQRTVTAPNGTLVIQDTVQYYDADSGFWVLPRLSGDQVTLLISPRTTQVKSGPVPTFEVQSTETTVSGRLGQWIAIGGIEQSSRRTSREFLSGSSDQASENRTIQVRVDEVP